MIFRVLRCQSVRLRSREASFPGVVERKERPGRTGHIPRGSRRILSLDEKSKAAEESAGFWNHSVRLQSNPISDKPPASGPG